MRTLLRRAPAVPALTCAADPAAPTPPAGPAANDPPPALPQVSTGCVGPSPVRYTGLPHALARMAPYYVWPLTQGDGVTVAILDSGVSQHASSLDGAVTAGVDVVSGGPAGADCLGRGTAMAAIVAGRGMPDTAVAGMAPRVTVLPIRIIDTRHALAKNGIADGIRAATAAGAGIILVGVGQLDDTQALRAAVTDAASHDVLIVAPLNDQSQSVVGQAPPVWFPAAYPQVIAVGGVDVEGRPWPAEDATGQPVLRAPSAGAVVAGPSGNGHYTVGGTAIAAAYVAGAAALVRAYHRDLTAAAVRERLTLTALRSPGASAGVVDAYAAVASVDPWQAKRLLTAVPDAVTLPTVDGPDPAVVRAAIVSTIVALLMLVAVITIWVVRRRR